MGMFVRHSWIQLFHIVESRRSGTEDRRRLLSLSKGLPMLQNMHQTHASVGQCRSGKVDHVSVNVENFIDLTYPPRDESYGCTV